MPDKFTKKPAAKKPARKKTTAKKAPAKKAAAKTPAKTKSASTKKTAAKKSAVKKPVKETKVSEEIQPSAATPATDEASASEEPKSFEDNVDATLEEETPGAVPPPKKDKPQAAAAVMSEAEDVPVEDLLGGVQGVLGDFADSLKQAAGKIELPEINLPKGILPKMESEAGDVQVESLGDGLTGLFKGTFAEGVVSDITGTATDLVDKVSETVTNVVEKIRKT